MARTKKASNDQQNRKAAKQQQSISVAESANNEAVTSTPIQCGEIAAIETPTDAINVDDKSDNQNHPQTSTTSTTSTIMANSDRLSGDGESLGRSESENVDFAGSTISDDRVDETFVSKNEKTESTDSATNEEANVNDESAITDDLNISGVSALMTDDSEASSIIDLTDSINTTKENSQSANGDGQRQGSTSTRPKSIRKQLKRLTSTTAPRYNIATGRTSKGTPYARKLSSSTNRILANGTKFSTGKKERITDEIKKSANVKRVTFNHSPSVKGPSTAAKLNHAQSTSKKQSAVKMPNFKDIHKKMFEKMESIDVTVQKREERMKAASSKKESKGPSSQGNDDNKSTKSKKVVRQLDSSQPGGPLKISQADDTSKLLKSARSKSLRSAPKVEVLQERSNRDTVFKFSASSDPKIVAQPISVKKTVENRATRRQQAYKARPVPRTQNSDRLKGVRLNRRFELQMKYREDQNEA